ncbi:MAG: pentapeptide repeat-containing protein [Gemmatimonadaceae bacterium]
MSDRKKTPRTNRTEAARPDAPAQALAQAPAAEAPKAAAPKPPSRFTKAKTFILAVWAIFAALTAWYGNTFLKIRDDRRHRRDTIASVISSLHKAKTPTENKATLDSLTTFGLARDLEPFAINGLMQFIGDKARRLGDAAGCRTWLVAPTGDAYLQRANVSQSLALIRQFQLSQAAPRTRAHRAVNSAVSIFSTDAPPAIRSLKFDQFDLRDAALDSLDLRSASFAGACLSRARFSSAQLGGASFRGAHLDSAVFDSAAIDGTSFENTSMRFASLQDARGHNSIFTRADLSGADMSGIQLDSARFQGTNFSCAAVGNANIKRAYFSGAVANWTFFGGDSIVDAQKWNEILSFKGAYMAGAEGLSAGMREFARARGAVPDTSDQFNWTQSKSKQLVGKGVCALAK